MNDMTASSSPVNGVAAPVATVNCHIRRGPCNMKRRHRSSFAIFMDTPADLKTLGLEREDFLALVRLLCGAGFRKTTFAMKPRL